PLKSTRQHSDQDDGGENDGFIGVFATQHHWTGQPCPTFKTGALNRSATLPWWFESPAATYNRWCAGGENIAAKSSGRRLPAGSSRRRYAISQNHLFAHVTREYVHFRQATLARKGLEETEFLPTKRASEQSSIGH